MKKCFILLLGLSLLHFSCSQKKSKLEFNSESQELNKKALQLIKEAKYDSALILLDRAIEIDKEFYPAYQNKIFIYNNRQDYKNALAVADQQVVINPQVAGAWVIYGMLNDVTGDSSKAIKCYKKGMSLFDDQSSKSAESMKNYKVNRAFILILLGKDQDAKIALQEFKLEYPNDLLVTQKIIDGFESMTRNDFLKNFTK
jgi:tetratricopeptide (TPR) repeat protein